MSGHSVRSLLDAYGTGAKIQDVVSNYLEASKAEQYGAYLWTAPEDQLLESAAAIDAARESGKELGPLVNQLLSFFHFSPL